VDAQSRSLNAAENALPLIHANYEAGTANYLQVLIIDGQYQQEKIGYLQAVAQRYQDTAALGGGWWNAEENVAGTASKKDNLLVPLKKVPLRNEPHVSAGTSRE
jgi:outer membrane protein TolC